MWYRRVIGGDRCPIVDTWWQTETGAIMISPLPGVTATKPGSAMRPLPGISADVVDDAGPSRCPTARAASWCSTEPWPSMLRGDLGRPASATARRTGRGSPGIYFAGDGAKKDDDGDLWLLGRVDDVMNVSGPPHLDHRGRVGAGLAPVRSPRPPSSAPNDATTGQAIVAFVIPRGGAAGGDRRARRGAAQPRRQGDRPDRQAARDVRRARAARRPGRARSCGGCCATSPSTATSATPPR